MPLGQHVAGRGNYLYANGQEGYFAVYEGVPNYSESPFAGDQSHLKTVLGDLNVVPDSLQNEYINIPPNEQGLFTHGAYLNGNIYAEKGYLRNLKILGQLQMLENGRILLGESASGNQFAIGDVGFNESTGSISVTVDSLTVSDLGGGTGTSGSKLSSAYSGSKVNSQHTFTASFSATVDYTRSGSSPFPLANCSITVYIIGYNGSTQVDQAYATDAASGNYGSDNLSVSVDYTPPSSVDTIRVKKEINVKAGTPLRSGGGQTLYNGSTYISATAGSNDISLSYISGNDSIGPNGIKYSTPSNTIFKLDATSNPYKGERLKIRDGNFEVRNGDIITYDSGGNKALQITKEGQIIFYQSKGSDNGGGLPYGAEAMMFAKSYSGGNVNLGWVERSGATNEAF